MRSMLQKRRDFSYPFIQMSHRILSMEPSGLVFGSWIFCRTLFCQDSDTEAGVAQRPSIHLERKEDFMHLVGSTKDTYFICLKILKPRIGFCIAMSREGLGEYRVRDGALKDTGIGYGYKAQYPSCSHMIYSRSPSWNGLHVYIVFNEDE